MKLFAIVMVTAITSTTAALPIPSPIRMIPSFVSLDVCKTPCCGFGCYPGMFSGYKRSNELTTMTALA